MKRGRAGLLALGLAVYALSGCYSMVIPGISARRWHCDRDDRLVGTWTTGVSMSQLGPGYERITYNCDCTYKARSTVLMAVVPIHGSEEGWYTASGGKLTTDVGYGNLEYNYSFEGKSLVIQQGVSAVRYRNVRHEACKDRVSPP